MANPPSLADARFGETGAIPVDVRFSAANRIAVSCIVATLAFWAYTQTLLPGVDLGDTGGFQAAVLWPEVSARQAYPLYFGLARPFVMATSPGNPARALNLFSAVWAAAAVGLLTFLCASITRSLAAGAVAGGLLAFSYTFWTQAVIAEVYSLHLTFVGTCLLALYAYSRQPTTRRLAVFFAAYALSFGNHLGMILLLVPFAVFLIHATPGPGGLFRPPVVCLALAMAVMSMLQYSPNFMAVWASFDAPQSWTERVAAFWFDVTKADWRESMVLGVRMDQTTDRLGMWWFDARQQFGVAALGLAAIGVAALWRMARPWAVLVLTAYALNTVFALTYNVGDPHVFLLPGHFLTALCAGAGAAWCTRAAPGRTATLVLLPIFLMAGWRGWTTWPAADRHADRRGEQLVARLTNGLNERDALLVAHLNWQLENVLLYVSRYVRPDLAWVKLGDVRPHLRSLVEDNHTLGRDVVLSAEAAEDIVSVYGSHYPVAWDSAIPRADLAQAVAMVPRGMPYVLSVLTPPREYPLDPAELAAALTRLMGGKVPARSPAAYELFAGITGESPQVYRASNRPFEEAFQILDEQFLVRMDSWLPSDTFRRAGFGHVLRGREHILILERGLNLTWVGSNGQAAPPYYAASLFAAQARYRLLAAAPQLAHLRPQDLGIRLRASGTKAQ